MTTTFSLTSSDVVSTCGCVRHADQTWTLCADCASRIGTFGTCLACGGPDNAGTYIVGLPEYTGCCAECARQELADAIEDGSITLAQAEARAGIAA